MPKGLPRVVKDNIEKCRSAAVAAVDAYNRPGPRFRTAQFAVLVIMAWTALFHAVFYRRKRRPWYTKPATRTGVRYVRVDGDPKHWDLAECLRQYFAERQPAERRNLEFLIGLRNKIEHRHLPELDPALYGECQASLLNLEEYLVREFGQRFALAEQLSVSLQFSQVLPDERQRATKLLMSNNAKTVREYVERFRGGLAGPVLNSMKYSFTVFLVPKVTGRASAADAAVQFVKVDEASADELERLERLNVLIKEKHIPIANLDMLRPSEVVAELKRRLPFVIDLHVHTCAWKHYAVRPAKGDAHPERTKPQYCVYDTTHEDYVYTKAWTDRLAVELADPATYERVVGRSPRPA